MASQDFCYRELPLLNKKVHRLGLAFNYGIDPKGVQWALDQGLNYLYWAKLRKGDQHHVIRAALKTGP